MFKAELPLLLIDGYNDLENDYKLIAIGKVAFPQPGYLHTPHQGTDWGNPGFNILSFDPEKLSFEIESAEVIPNIETKYLACMYTFSKIGWGVDPNTISLEKMYMVDRKANDIFHADVKNSTHWSVLLDNEENRQEKIEALEKHFLSGGTLEYIHDGANTNFHYRDNMQVGEKIVFEGYCRHTHHGSGNLLSVGIVSASTSERVYTGSSYPRIAFDETLTPTHIYYDEVKVSEVDLVEPQPVGEAY